MKKLLVLVALFTTVYVSQAHAQANNDPAAMKARYVERVKPMLIEKAKISDAEADKVLDINFNARTKMRGLRDLAPDERKKQAEQIQADMNKDYRAIPLTEDQVKAVNEFFEEQRKQMQQRQQQNGGGNAGQ